MNQEHPINIRLIDHVVIRVQILGRMIDFYWGALGNGPSLYINDPDGNVVELKGMPNS